MPGIILDDLNLFVTVIQSFKQTFKKKDILILILLMKKLSLRGFNVFT